MASAHVLQHDPSGTAREPIEARIHRAVILGLVLAVLASLGLQHPEGTQRWAALAVVGTVVLIALSLGLQRVWPLWRATGGVIAAGLLAVLFAVTGGTESVYQDALVAIMVVAALTLPLHLVVANVVAATLAAASPVLYDTAYDGLFVADLVADLGIWFAVTVGVYLQTRMLRRHAERLHESDQLRISFLRATSHELRTPLTAVSGFAETLHRLNDTLSPDQRLRIVEQLGTNADRLSSLIEDLLDVDRLTSGLVRANLTASELHVLVARCVGQVDDADRHIELSLEPVTANIDAPKLERVVINLVANAVRHTPPGGRVEVDLARVEQAIVLTVTDQGDGIPDGYAERIFEPFVQGPERRNAAQPGTGLGLTLVREFVALHGGTVAAENRTAGGARFVVTLPWSLAPDGDATDGPVPQTAPDTTRSRS